MTDTPAQVIATANDYESLVEAFRVRAAQLNISRLEIDFIGGLASGHASKMLCPVPIKSFGRSSLGPLLGALALKLVVVVDEEQLERIAGRISHRRPDAGRVRGPHPRVAVVAA